MAMVDCTFEQKVCALFQVRGTPHLAMSAKDKVYKLRTLKPVLDKDDILALLSGDDYKTNADVFAEDTHTWLMLVTGRAGGLNSFSSQYLSLLEDNL